MKRPTSRPLRPAIAVTSFLYLLFLIISSPAYGYIPEDHTNATDKVNADFRAATLPQLGIDGPVEVCSNFDPVTYTGIRNGMPAGVGVFSIDPAPNGTFVDNGNATATLTVADGDAGAYTITFTYTDESGMPNSIELAIEVYDPNFDLACLQSVGVNLQDGCQRELSVQSLLFGNSRCFDEDAYTLQIQDNKPENGAVVDSCGTYKYTIDGPEGFNCWGYVTAEDKTPPQIICPDEQLPPMYGDLEPGAAEFKDLHHFVCSDLDFILIEGTMTYHTDEQGAIIEISDELKAILDVTGYPGVFDNCGNLWIEVSDHKIHPEDPCDEIIIERTFKVTDECQGLMAECTQEITIFAPSIDDVVCPDNATLACDDDVKLDANGNPHPDETGYPTIPTFFDEKQDLIDVFCNISVSYEDSPRSEICAGTYKIIRTWTIIDWCPSQGYNPRICTQLIKVVDEEGPTVVCPDIDYHNDGQTDGLIFSTGPYDCTAAFEVPLPEVSDNCSPQELITITIEIEVDGVVHQTIPPGASRFVSNVPLGCHILRYIAKDDCGNKTIEECPLLIEDQVAPSAVCTDDLNISIGGKGFARVAAEDIDEGSSDQCGPIRIEVRRRILNIEEYDCLDIFDVDGNGVILGDEVRLNTESGDPDGDGLGDQFYYTPWEEYVEFTCCDMNEQVRIELRVWDDRNGNGEPGDTDEVILCNDEQLTRLVEDNYNVCWLDVLVEDKVEATCIPPPAAEIDCDQLPATFDPTDEVQMGILFGQATGTDNCPGWTVEELDPLTEDLDQCGFGTFIRRFRVTDAKGLQSDVCQQLVTVHEVHNYWIKFPKDAEATCELVFPDTIMTSEGDCDLLAISVKDETFSASGDECFKIFRTYSVINWCEYDGQSDPVVVSRDEDCDGVPGDEDVYVIVQTIDGPTWCINGEPDTVVPLDAGPQDTRHEHVWYDRDSDPFNDNPAAGEKDVSCDWETNPEGFWKELFDTVDDDLDTEINCEMESVGYWQYTQVIKVYDNVKPIITVGEFPPFCSFSSDLENDCPVEAPIDFTVDENCVPDDLTIKITLDAFRDGTTNGSLEDGTLSLYGSYPDFTVVGTYPLGEHRLLVSVRDGCGNTGGVEIDFEVVDCKAPSPTCINGLAIELMPVIPAADVDGDGDQDQGAMTIWASDFVASPAFDCTGEVTYSINRTDEPNDPEQTSITLTCDDNISTLIQIWAYDEAGNADRCETYVLVQDNMIQCGGVGSGSVAGVVAKENGDAVEGAHMELSGQGFVGVMTNTEGRYSFTNIQEGFDYTVTPDMNVHPLNGVSTFDLVLMSKHILGIQPLAGPYQLIAADVNNSRSITAMDAIALRRMILNIDLKFSNNTSWRFIPANYTFPNPADPWQQAFPEVININNLNGTLADEDFIAIKLGDLNGNARSNIHNAEARTIKGVMSFDLQDMTMAEGELYQVDFRADELNNILGYQGTLQFDPTAVALVDIVYGIAKGDNFGLRLIDEGLITTSWHQSLQQSREDISQEVIFSLLLRARKRVQLSEVLQMSSRLTVAEAYNQQEELLELVLDYGQGEEASAFSLYQNTPNPFRQETNVGFYLPAEGEATLRIHDAAGRTVKLLRGNFARGYNQFRLQRSDLGVPGVLYYTLTSGAYTATKKMILIR